MAVDERRGTLVDGSSANSVAPFPPMPCEPAGESDYAEDNCHYCKQHDKLVCPACHRHVREDEEVEAPGTPLTCAVHGVIARVGHP